MWKALERAGERVSRCRVQRLMRAAGIQGAKRRGKSWRTTRPDPHARRRPDLVQRDFSAGAPNELWVADLSYLRCWEGLVFFSFVLDAYSRKVVGWQLAPHMRTTLVLDALKMALGNRRPGADVALVHHSDRGSQGGFKRSSQRSIEGSCDGREEKAAVGSGWSAGDAVTGASAGGAEGAPPAVLGGDRSRVVQRGRGGRAAVSAAVGVRWFREGGGMPSVALGPPSGRYLSFAEREELALLRVRGCGVREIARALGRSPSTISRELRRNAATRGGGLEYRASTAQWHADRRGRRPKPAKLAENPGLRRYVQDRLVGAVERPDGVAVDGPAVEWVGRRHGRRKDRRWARSWSPEQISNRLRLDFPDDESMRVSHEAIYRSLYVQGRGALRRELTACLRTGRALRVPRARTRRGKSFVTDEILISERPAEAVDRAVPGHWEGDLILGPGSSAIGTLVERSSRFTMLLHLPPMDGGDGPRIKNR